MPKRPTTQQQELSNRLIEVGKENYKLLTDVLQDKINSGTVIKTNSPEPIIVSAFDNIVRAVQYDGKKRNPEIAMMVSNDLRIAEVVYYANDKTNEDIEFLAGDGKLQERLDCSKILGEFLKDIQSQPYKMFDDILDIYEDVYVLNPQPNSAKEGNSMLDNDCEDEDEDDYEM